MSRPLTVAGLLVIAALAIPGGPARPVAAHAASSATVPLLTGGVMHYEGDAGVEGHFSETNGTSQSTYDESLTGLHFSADYLLMGDYYALAGDVPKSDWPGGLVNNLNHPLAWSSNAAPDHNLQVDTTSSGWERDECTGTVQFDEPTITFGDRNPLYNRVVDFINGLGEMETPVGSCHDTDSDGGDVTGTDMTADDAVFAAAAVNAPDNVLHFPLHPYQGTTLTQAVSETLHPSDSSTATANGTMSLTCALCVSDIKFRQQVDPTGDAQLEDVPANTTYDGNVVEVSATVHNTLSRDLVAPVSLVTLNVGQLREAKGTRLLQPITFPAGSTTTVTEDIDTSGLAWGRSGANRVPALAHQIVVATPFGGAERELDVLPKPVVLVHGWFSAAKTWRVMEQHLHAVDPDWAVYAVGDGQVPGIMDTSPVYGGHTIEQNAQSEALYIEGVRRKTGAQHVDLVVHSMGGLISRDYIDHLMQTEPDPPGGRPIVGHLVMLGTPNMGSDCAVPASILGVIASAFLGAEPTIQLRSDYVTNVFDPAVTHEHDVPFSVDAGTGYPTCGLADGDGVVTRTSAWYTYYDVGSRPGDLHTDLTDDDAIVSQWIVPHVGQTSAEYAAARIAPAARRSARVAAVAPTRTGMLSLVTHQTLAAGAGVRTPVAVPRSTRWDLTVVADPQVSVIVRRPNGTVAARQAAGSAVAGNGVRMLRFAAPRVGTWSVQLRNTGKAATAATLGASLEGAAVRLTAAVTTRANHRLLVRGTLRRGRIPIQGAVVVAQFRTESGRLATIRLRDDGRHRDARARDGVYTGMSRRVPALPRRQGVLVLVHASKAHLQRWKSVLAVVSPG